MQRRPRRGYVHYGGQLTRARTDMCPYIRILSLHQDRKPSIRPYLRGCGDDDREHDWVFALAYASLGVGHRSLYPDRDGVLSRTRSV